MCQDQAEDGVHEQQGLPEASVGGNQQGGTGM